MLHSDKAVELFVKGYNCSQSVVGAFTDLTGMDRQMAVRLASSFGAGMGRLREVCGGVSGALIVLGVMCGYDDPENAEEKTEHYHLVQEFARRFREKNGTIICRELLQGVNVKPGDKPEPRTEEYYASRPCVRFVEDAAQITEDILREKGIL